MCALGCPLLCSQLSVHGGTESAEMPSKEFIRAKVHSSRCALSTGLPSAGKLPWKWSFLLPVSFRTHFTASYSCMALLGPFSCCSPGWGTPGRNNLCSVLGSAGGWGFPDGADPGTLGAESRGILCQPRQGLLSPTLWQHRHECQPWWHCPTAPAGLCNGTDATQR